MNYKVNIADEKGRTLVKIRGDRVLVARFPDMTETTKQIISEFYEEFTGENPNRIMDFLNFENDDMEFCS